MKLYVQAYFNKGYKFLESGNFQKAIECYDKTLELDPSYVEAWYNKGIALNKMGIYPEAIICYDMALILNPNYIDALNNKFVALINLKMFDEALKNFDGVKCIDPYFALELKERADGNFNEAVKGHNLRNNLVLAITIYKVILKKGLVKGTVEYASALANQGISMTILAENGINSASNYNRAIELLHSARKEGFDNDTENYFVTIVEEGIARLRFGALSINQLHLKKSIELFKYIREENCELMGYSPLDLYCFEILARKELANFGIDEESNQQEAHKIFQMAIKGISSDDLLKKSLQLCMFAIRGLNSKENLKVAIDLFESLDSHKKHENIGIEIGIRLDLIEYGIDPCDNYNKVMSLCENTRKKVIDKKSCASSFNDEAIAEMRFSNFSPNSVENLENAIKLFKKSRNNGFVKNSINYANTLMSEAVACQWLAERGINRDDNLNKAINLCIRAKNEGFKRNSLYYGKAMLNEGNAKLLKAKFSSKKEDIIENAKESISISESSREKGLIEGTPDYGKTLVNEGVAREILADMNVQRNTNLKKAINLYERARSEGLEPNTLDYGKALMNESLIRLSNPKLDDRKNDANSMIMDAKKIFLRLNDRFYIIKINGNIGYLCYSNKKYNKAYEFLKEAIKYIEDERSSIKTYEYKKEYFKTVISIYETMVFTCLALGKKDKKHNEEAFKYAELTKGRAFLEILAEKRINSNESFMDLDNTILNEINREPIDLNNLKNILNDKCLIEYFLGQDTLAIFVINKAGLTIKVKEIYENVFEKTDELRKLIFDLQNYCSKRIDPNNTQEYKSAEKILEELYDMLIKPIIDKISEETDLVIIPHKFLHVIPFQALKDDKYLIEDYKISFAQSASSLKFLKKGMTKEALVVVGGYDEDDEAAEVAKILDATLITKNEANKDRIINEIENKGIIHFSSHGEFDPYNPEFSKILLGDGFLTAADFMNLDTNASLITLSACETGLNSIESGDELEGFIRAIQYSGCRFVIASLWKVPIPSTEELFVDFYSNIVSSNMVEIDGIVSGMQKAEMNLIEKYGFFQWASFQVYGI